MSNFRDAFERKHGHFHITPLSETESPLGFGCGRTRLLFRTRRKLATLRVCLWDSEGGTSTPHSPKNLPPEEDNQMDFPAKKMNVVGRWIRDARKYDRIVCFDALLLRNNIFTKIASGWELVPAYHIPLNFDDNERIGKTPLDTSPNPMDSADCPTKPLEGADCPTPSLAIEAKAKKNESSPVEFTQETSPEAPA